MERVIQKEVFDKVAYDSILEEEGFEVFTRERDEYIAYHVYHNGAPVVSFLYDLIISEYYIYAETDEQADKVLALLN